MWLSYNVSAKDPIDAVLLCTIVTVMSLASYPKLQKLPRSQKLKLADELWRAGVSDSMPVPAEQKKMLDSRWTAYRAGKAKRIDMAELERRVFKK